MRGFDHLVFDLDGTLVDSGADLAGAVNHVLERLGLPSQPPSTLIGYVGDGARRLMERALGQDHAARLDAALPLFLEHYGAHLLDRTLAYPGIPETLAALRDAGVGMSVLTNKPEAMSRTLLAGLGMHGFFDDVVGGDTEPTRKPDPAGLERVRRNAGASRERTLVVGDSPVDAATAQAGGVAFCGVTWGLQPERLRAVRPARLIDAPRELVAIARPTPQ